jgi:broad specificity phosphatase PhoE
VNQTKANLKVKAIFIRHGQSTANAGDWNQPFAQIELTPLGQHQAEVLATRWDFTPSLIVVSPFVRTQQTAAPTIARFPDVPVETWPIQEFTYWDIAHWDGSTPEAEVEAVELYWRVADPEHRRGKSETFGELLGRAEAALKRLEALDVHAPVLLFTHGHFMQAVRHVVMFPHWTAEEKMLHFHGFDDRTKVKNTQLITAEFDGATWTID